MAWLDDLEKSMNQFDKLILPVLSEFLPGCNYIRVEGTAEEIAQILDKNIGIDAMVEKGGIYWGLGSRIQSDSGVWNTFTIRCGRSSGHITEFEKLEKAIKHEALRPHLTMQAYIEKDELKSIAIARTKDIVEFIHKHNCPIRQSYDSGSSAEFIVVDWEKLAKEYKVKILDFRKEQVA